MNRRTLASEDCSSILQKKPIIMLESKEHTEAGKRKA